MGHPKGDFVCPLRIEELDETIEPYVLKNTHDVLSIGFRCLEKGYTFVWPAWDPTL